MAFAVPTLPEITQRIRSSMRAFMPGTDAWIEPNNLSVVSKAFALALGSVYERLAYLYRQAFASTADGFHLEYRHAFEYGITRKPEQPAQGWITFVQTGTPVTIPAGYVVNGPNGVAYAFLTTAVPGAGGETTVEVRAFEGGAHTNLVPLTPMSIAPDASYPSLPDAATVGPEGIGGGADLEDDESLRQRVLLRKRLPPHGGAASDYRQWALAVPGVTRVFVSPFVAGDPLEVSTPLQIFPMFDDTRENGIPTGSDLSAVQAAIEPLRPVTAQFHVLAASPRAINIRIANLDGDSEAIRAAIEANLRAMFFERAEVATAAAGLTFPRAWITEAIARAPGHKRHTLVQPSADVALSGGQIPIVGTVTYGA